MEVPHTSGHADITTISHVVKTVIPSKIIPVHTEASLNFPNNDAKILIVKDGQELFI